MTLFDGRLTVKFNAVWRRTINLIETLHKE